MTRKRKPRAAKPKQLPPHVYEAEVVDAIPEPEPEPEPGAARPIENVAKLFGILFTGMAIGYLTAQPAKPTPVQGLGRLFTDFDALMGKKKL